jgi:hypothetical protein
MVIKCSILASTRVNFWDENAHLILKSVLKMENPYFLEVLTCRDPLVEKWTELGPVGGRPTP